MAYPPPNQPQQPPGLPGQGESGHMPAGPPPAKKNKKLLFGIIGGALALCCGGSAIAAIAGGDDKPEASVTTPLPGKEATQTPKTTSEGATKAPAKEVPKEAVASRDSGPGVGDPVRDGKFEFTVTKLDCSKTKVGTEYVNEKAQGKFCIISVTVKNIGKEAQMFAGSAQKAFDAEGTEFSNDTAAELHANTDTATFLNEINPGNQVKGKLVFDVPKSTKLTAIELHDSLFSGGVKVSLL